MKSATRLLAILLAFILVFAGCGDITVSATPTPTPTPAPTPTPEPGVATYDGPAVVVIPGEEDSAFGLVAPTYDMEGNPAALTLGEAAGDTDILMPVGIRLTDDSTDYDELELMFDAEFPVTFTAKHYVDGKEVPGGDIPASDARGYVEQYQEDGSWMRMQYPNFRTPAPGPYNPNYDKEALALLSDIPATDENGAVYAAFPIETPGVYRYTLYFRETIDHTKANITTGEELYKITFIVTIPISDKVFDVIAVSEFIPSPITYGEREGEDGYAIYVFFRINSDDNLADINYNMTRGGKVEMRDGDEWVEIENGVGTVPPRDNGQDEGNSGGMLGEKLHFPCVFSIYLPDPEAEYRITLTFTDDYLENHELTFYVNSDEG